jgi:hypothetical protein
MPRKIAESNSDAANHTVHLQDIPDDILESRVLSKLVTVRTVEGVESRCVGCAAKRPPVSLAGHWLT